MEEALELAAQGQLRPVTAAEFPLEQVVRAVDFASSLPRLGKVLLRPQE
jgi:NADPH:quinone reductase-like Zn-dependent oxidoreductase